MQFLVPEFITLEPRVIGPITVKQFILIVIGGVIIAISYKLAPSFLIFVLISLLVIGFVILFGFLKYNSRPFSYFFINFIKFISTPNVRVWKKEIFISPEKHKKVAKKSELVKKDKVVDISKKVEPKKQLDISKLSELSLIVNTGGKYKLNDYEK